jgi:hypothetical protein
MRQTKIVTSREPEFLKAAYATPYVALIDHAGFVVTGERFIVKTDKAWEVFLMTESRAHYRVGSFNNIRAAIFAANR